MEMKRFIVVNQYNGMKFIRAERDTLREALDFMQTLLNNDAKRKGRGAKLVVRVFDQYGCYSN